MASGSRVLITPTFRMSFPNLLEPRPYMQNGKPKGDPTYNTEMLFEPDDLTKFRLYDEESGELAEVDIRKVLVDVAKEKWDGINVKEAVAAKDLRWPIKKGSDIHAKKLKAGKKGTEYYEGMEVLNAKTGQDYPPTLKYKDKNTWVTVARELDTSMSKAKGLFVGGNYGYAEVSLRAIEVDGEKHITFYLNQVRFVKQGDRIGGGGSLMDRFDGIDGGETDYDPTKDMDDEIPF